MNSLWLDLSYGIQLLRRNPGFTLVAVLTLALGIGATTAIFSVMNAAMFRPLTFPDPGNVVLITMVQRQEGFQTSPGPAIRERWNEESELVEHVGTFGPITEFAVSGERVYFNRIDVDALPVFDVQPYLGRWYEQDEPMIGGTAATLVISYGLWQRLGADPGIIGRSLPGWTAGWGNTVIGVMPEGFRIAPWLANADAWHAMDSTPTTVARLRPGVSPEQAEAELGAIAVAFRRDAGDSSADDWRVELEPLGDAASAQYSGTLYLLLGAVGFVLLIACANVVNLQLSRSASRQSEMATRSALGAGPVRLVRQLLTENLLLALAGGLAGLLVAVVGVKLFVGLAPDFYPPEDIRLDLPVLLFTLAVSVSVGVLFGLIPALSVSRPDLQTSIRHGARGATGSRQWVRRSLVVSELALALVLLVGAGLMVNTYARVLSVDSGVDPESVTTMELNLRGLEPYRIVHDAFSDYEVLPAADRVFTDILEGLRAIPGVTAVGMASSLPPEGGFRFGVELPGHAEIANGGAQYHEASGDLFKALGVPLLQGRTFNELDVAGATGVVILNEMAARQFFPGEDPLGQQVRIRVGDDGIRQVIGVVGDTRTSLRDDPEPTVYVPYRQHISHYANATVALVNIDKDFALRTSGSLEGLGTAMREAVHAADPAIAVGGVMSMRARLAQSAAAESFLMRILGIAAGLGVFLAAIGIYGVVSYSVVQRTDEFGIRAALGAQKARILALVLREGLVMTLIGLVVGLMAAFGLTRLIESQLYGVTPMDPATILAVAALLVGVALAACYVPARRAANQDPMAALRVE